MSKDKTLEKLLSEKSDKNLRFQDLRKLFTKEHIYEIMNLQPLKDGKAKPYQVKQVRNLFLKYKFHIEED